MQNKLTPHEVRRIAVEALVDSKTIDRYLSGRPVRPTIHARIIEALKKTGHLEAAEAQRRAGQALDVPTTPEAA